MYHFEEVEEVSGFNIAIFDSTSKELIHRARDISIHTLRHDILKAGWNTADVMLCENDKVPNGLIDITNALDNPIVLHAFRHDDTILGLEPTNFVVTWSTRVMCDNPWDFDDAIEKFDHPWLFDILKAKSRLARSYFKNFFFIIPEQGRSALNISLHCPSKTRILEDIERAKSYLAKLQWEMASPDMIWPVELDIKILREMMNN